MTLSNKASDKMEKEKRKTYIFHLTKCVKPQLANPGNWVIMGS